MNTTRKLPGRWLALVLAILLLCSLTGCGSSTQPSLSSLQDFSHAKLGTFPGSSSEEVTIREFPHAELTYYTALSDMTLALKTGKIDGFILDPLFHQGISWETDAFTYIDQPLETIDYTYFFPHTDFGRQLKSQMDAFLASARENGTLEALQNKWFADTEPLGSIDFSGLTGENGTIYFAYGADIKPFAYLKNDQPAGYEIELAVLFAREYGYDLKYSDVHFDAALFGAEAGKYDMGAFAVNPTEERADSLLFSEPSATGNMVLITRNVKPGQKFQTLSDLSDGTFGCITGSIYNNIVAEQLPEASVNVFSSPSDALLALEQGKIDAYLEDDVLYAAMRWEKDNITALEAELVRFDLAFAFNRNLDPLLKDQINTFLTACQEDGTLQQLEAKWFAESEPQEHPDYRSLPATNGTIKVAVSPSLRPMSYKKGEDCSGYEIELLTLFAREYGYALELHDILFESVLPGLVSGKYDMAASCLAVTEERKESVDFSVPHYQAKSAVIIHAPSDGGDVDGAFLSNLGESFEKTFIREDRWKLLAEGILVTLTISILAAGFGSLLGFGLYMMTRSGKKHIAGLACGIGKVYSRIVAGTPVVVILMILFYVVFAQFKDMSGVLIAIIGFSLTFGAFVYQHLAVSVNSVAPGQTEAAFALGYPKNKAFFRIIFPQAMSVFLPSYCGQAVELVKATAVVGYIAVNDLTKMGDIIRSNTYEAFFPLLTTAVIYFVLTWLLALLLGLVKRRFEPQRRSREVILKGIDPV